MLFAGFLTVLRVRVRVSALRCLRRCLRRWSAVGAEWVVSSVVTLVSTFNAVGRFFASSSTFLRSDVFLPVFQRFRTRIKSVTWPIMASSCSESEDAPSVKPSPAKRPKAAAAVQDSAPVQDSAAVPASDAVPAPPVVIPIAKKPRKVFPAAQKQPRRLSVAMKAPRSLSQPRPPSSSSSSASSRSSSASSRSSSASSSSR